jgi:protocatechuate 3,4-dioxygenase beta subunit
MRSRPTFLAWKRLSEVIHPLFLPLTTQIYFEGDPHIAKDPWAKSSKVLSPLAKAGDGSSGAVDIVLANRPGQRRV